MRGWVEVRAFIEAMDKLAELVQDSKTREEADHIYLLISREINTPIADLIWDHHVVWDDVSWIEE